MPATHFPLPLLSLILSLALLPAACGFTVFGFHFQSSFFNDDFVTHRVLVGNATEGFTFMAEEGPTPQRYNVTGSDLFIPMTFPGGTRANTIEVVLSMDIFPELLQMCVWKDNKGLPITSIEDSRVEVCKTCSDFFDECLVQMHMRYNRQPPHVAPGYNFRMVSRLDEVEGHWMIRLTKKALPHHAVISLHLDIKTKDYDFAFVAWGGAVLSVALGAALLLVAAAVLTFCRRPILVVANALPTAANEADAGAEAQPRFADRVRAWWARRRAERYAPMQEDAPEDPAAPAGLAAAAAGVAPAGSPAEALPAPADAASAAATSSSSAVGAGAAGAAGGGVAPAPAAGAALSAQLWARGLVQRPSGPPPPEEEEEENFCRICRCVEPEADLFTPCNCDGSMKFVHRACLAEWREKTTNPVNRQYCSECKAAFRIVVRDAALRFVVDGIACALKIVAPMVVLEGLLVAAGYAFKGVAGVLQGDVGAVDWNPDLYHHILGLQLVAVYAIHFRVLAPVLQSSVGLLLLALLTALSLFLEVFTGYFAHFLLWCLGSLLWDWQVYYLSGCTVVALYSFYLHDSLVAAYHRWALQHRSEVVLDRSQPV